MSRLVATALFLDRWLGIRAGSSFQNRPNAELGAQVATL
jgi:hypothetical protein